MPTILPSPPVAVPPLTKEELTALCRGFESDGGAAYFEELSTAVQVQGLKTEVRWHRIVHDGTLDKPDLKKLVSKLIGLLIDFACTRGEISAAKKLFENTGSAEAFARLYEKARSLFTTQKTTGEPGELLLYMLTEKILGHPQVLCKFPLKTSGQMHAHGADGVHASTDPVSGHLRLHWGEAKFVSDLGKAIDDCFESLAELILQPENSKKSKDRDIELIRDYIDLDNEALENAICRYLDPDEPLNNKIKYCGIGVIGFDLDSYDELGKALKGKNLQAIQKYITRWTKRLQTGITNHKLEKVVLDIFLIPCDSVDTFRTEFIKKLGVNNADEPNT